MSYIVLSKRQVEGSFKVKLFKDKEKADSYRKQLIKQYYDVIILDKSNYKLITKESVEDWVYGGEDKIDPIPNLTKSITKLWNDHDEHLRYTNKREII